MKQQEVTSAMEKEKGRFRRLGTMIDCSRNAVMKPDAVKKWIDVTADLGYNALMLYTEDTYEVGEEPYFGYARGRYSKAELKDIDAYAAAKGMELIPCIQTLAHLNAIARWPEYAPHMDIADILLARDERTYTLIERMFETISECFTSKCVHIGMDEAHLFGRGRFLTRYGDVDRTAAMLEHLERVAEMGKRRGLSLAMWSDMFYRLAAGGEYYAAGAEIDKSVGRRIPENVELVYWDYYSTDTARYDKMLKSHAGIKPGTWFAGGLWSWEGFAPHNAFSIRATEAALAACEENGVQDVFLTLWGDDGAECAKFALLPSLFYAAQRARGNVTWRISRRSLRKSSAFPGRASCCSTCPAAPTTRRTGSSTAKSTSSTTTPSRGSSTPRWPAARERASPSAPGPWRTRRRRGSGPTSSARRRPSAAYWSTRRNLDSAPGRPTRPGTGRP